MKTAITCSLLTIFRSRSASILVALTLGAFALASAPRTFGVVPAPDGGYPGGNTAEGDSALFHLTTGVENTAVGEFALFNNTTTNDNTAIGFEALVDNFTGSNNTASGVSALQNNTTGSANTANGVNALFFNTTGNNNTANGVAALENNITGSGNTANGFDALLNNTTGKNNTADRAQALNNNATGIDNAGFGVNALLSTTTGNLNVALGVNSLQRNITGDNNTAQGVNALSNNTVGNNNTAIGRAALLRNTTGSSNIALGINAGGNLTIGDSNTDIGNAGVAAETNTIRVGTQGTQRRAFIAGISGTAASGSPVVVNSSGQLGVAVSSERFKEEIKRMDKASEAILALHPVTFRYKKNIDLDGVPQFGLVAEEVAKVDPDLVARDAKGEVYTVRYEAVNAMLLNEFLKEHRKVQALEASAAQQQKQIETLTAGLQKVTAQVEASKPAPQMVNNP